MSLLSSIVVAMDIASSTISLRSSGMAEVAETIVVQAVNSSGGVLTTGGETLALFIYTSATTLGDDFDYRSITMTDNGDGTYEASYVISAGSGTVTARVLKIGGNGIKGEYYSNSSYSGTPTIQIDSLINFADLNDSIRWDTMVKAPSNSTSFPFYIDGNESAEFAINGKSATSTYGGAELVSLSVTEGSFYWMYVNFRETGCCGAVYLTW